RGARGAGFPMEGGARHWLGLTSAAAAPLRCPPCAPAVPPGRPSHTIRVSRQPPRRQQSCLDMRPEERTRMETNASSGAEPPDWHSLEPDEVIRRLGSDRRRGLSADEARARLARFGANRLPPPPRRPAWLRLLRQFHNVLIYVMLAAAAIMAVLGHWVDMAVLLTAVGVNAVIGFIQEGKAEQALDAIRDMLSPHAMVVRGGERIEVPAETLVPGDLVVLASGDKVPADLRVVSARGLQVNEAILTGESQVVEKSPEPVSRLAALGDRRSMLYSGTLVASGQATAVVVAGGSATEIGRIG